MQYNVYEAKSSLSRLLDEVEAGKEVIIARHGRPVVRLEKIHVSTGRLLGTGRGEVELPDDSIWAPMSDEEVDALSEARPTSAFA